MTSSKAILNAGATINPGISGNIGTKSAHNKKWRLMCRFCNCDRIMRWMDLGLKRKKDGSLVLDKNNNPVRDGFHYLWCPCYDTNNW